MNSAQYEELVSRVAQKVRDGMPGLQNSSIGFGRRNRIQGASGYRHQIDVGVEAATVLLLIECKHWQEEVDTVGTLAFCARYIDIMARLDSQKKVLAALATVKGFDPGAVQLAKFFGVDLWHVKDEQDFVCRIETVVSVSKVEPCGVTDRVLIKVVRGGDSS